MRTRCETLESGDLSTFDQIFWLYFSKSRKNIFWKSQKLLKIWFFRFLLYNLMVCWHDIKHKLHAIVALHATKVIKMILEVMQPTYNPILVRILNKIRFCAKPLITLGVGPLTTRWEWNPVMTCDRLTRECARYERTRGLSSVLLPV